MPSREQTYGVMSVPANSVSSLLAKVQILTLYTSHHFVQNDKTRFLIPVPCFLFPVRGCHAIPQSTVVYGHCVRRIEGGNIAGTPRLQPPQSRPTNDGFAGTGETTFPTTTHSARTGKELCKCTS